MIVRNLDVICIITCEIPNVGKEENQISIRVLHALVNMSSKAFENPQ